MKILDVKIDFLKNTDYSLKTSLGMSLNLPPPSFAGGEDFEVATSILTDPKSSLEAEISSFSIIIIMRTLLFSI